MAYIGNSLQTAQPNYQIIDDISASFNGSTTTFAIQVGGATPVPFPVSAQHCMISVGGVIQQPDPTGTDGFLLSGSNIVFSAAPSSGEDFFGVILAGADYINVGASFPDGSEANPSLTFDQDLDTGLYRGGSGTTSVTANGNRIADFGPTAVVFNEDGDNVDFRVEGDTVTNLLEVDASRDTVVIGGDLEPATINSLAYPDAGALSNRNLIINGAMQVAQRGTASGSPTAGGTVFGVDRFYAYATQASKVTVQQNQASVTPPVGFQKYLGITSSSAYTSLSTDVFSFGQVIEAQNAAQLAWGTADAKTITLSFWVRSSLTGTHSGAIMNGSFNRSYPYTYTISSADTWEYKTITVPGDTSGTWDMAGNGKFAYIIWDYGTGSDKRGTAGAWTGSQKEGVTGAVQLVGTSGATWYITGVQLEAGSKATPFEHRSYGDELARCQRYFFSSFPQGTAPAKGVANTVDVELPASSASFAPNRYFGLQHRQNMRGPAAITFYNSQNGSAGDNTVKGYYWVDGGATGSGDYTVNLDVAGHNAFGGYIATSGYGNALIRFHYTASAEL